MQNIFLFLLIGRESQFSFCFFFFISGFDFPASIKKLQEKNESYQVSRNRMAEGMALALEKKDQVKYLFVDLNV